jgi:hypothetical protein
MSATLKHVSIFDSLLKPGNMNKVVFPRSFTFSVDDLGWNEGSNLSRNVPPGSVRAGIKRTFDLNDYKYIVDVAKAVGVRIQCLFVLCEMDREIMAQYGFTPKNGHTFPESFVYFPGQEMLHIVLNAANMQGSRGIIKQRY